MTSKGMGFRVLVIQEESKWDSSDELMTNIDYPRNEKLIKKYTSCSAFFCLQNVCITIKLQNIRAEHLF